jgi:hypothetical protein
MFEISIIFEGLHLTAATSSKNDELHISMNGLLREGVGGTVRVRVNQRIHFLPNVFYFLLPARLQWVQPAGGGGGGAESGRRLVENVYVDLP